MSFITARATDPSAPLKNKSHEAFVQAYLELDRENPLKQSKFKRKEAYLIAYPETTAKDIDALSKRLLRKEEIVIRIDHLTKDEESGIENEIKWNQMKAEDSLMQIILNADKDADKINALKELNKLRKIGVDSSINDDITIKFINEFGDLEED